eukprot:968721-Amphidinium_carterae.2
MQEGCLCSSCPVVAFVVEAVNSLDEKLRHGVAFHSARSSVLATFQDSDLHRSSRQSKHKEVAVHVRAAFSQSSRERCMCLGRSGTENDKLGFMLLIVACGMHLMA